MDYTQLLERKGKVDPPECEVVAQAIARLYGEIAAASVEAQHSMVSDVPVGLPRAASSQSKDLASRCRRCAPWRGACPHECVAVQRAICSSVSPPSPGEARRHSIGHGPARSRSVPVCRL